MTYKLGTRRSLTNETQPHHDDTARTEANRFRRPALLPRDGLRPTRQLPRGYLRGAPRMAGSVRCFGVVRRGRHGRVLLADATRIFADREDGHRSVPRQGADSRRRGRPDPHGDRVRAGSGTPRRARHSADAALSDGSVAGRHSRARRGGVPRRAEHGRDHLQPRELEAQRRHAGATRGKLPEPDRLQGRRRRNREHGDDPPPPRRPLLVPRRPADG
ncbi:hypothetical protein AWB82_03349 [Caballeronia glebae]|uniref:Uncharacterized protein n=1 Tax=Caballeronia glebae TaxID=1777143 RepID=A0A158B1S0_9BURK|nr:hypothetical protein AWB82_03349 [Caballeronia glebae]